MLPTLPALEGRAVTDFQPESEVLAWIALRRLNKGYVVNLAGRWLDFGSPVPSYLIDTFHQLTRNRLLTLADPAQGDLVRRATLTELGRTQYTTLLDKYGTTHLARAEVGAAATEFPH